MNKRQVIASLNNIVEELDNQGFYVESNQISSVMKKIAQMGAQPDTRQNILKMLDVNLNFIYNELSTGNPVRQEYIDEIKKVKNDLNSLSNILPLYLGKRI